MKYTVRKNANVHVYRLPQRLTIQHRTHIDPPMHMCTLKHVHATYGRCESLKNTAIHACTHIKPPEIKLEVDRHMHNAGGKEVSIQVHMVLCPLLGEAL